MRRAALFFMKALAWLAGHMPYGPSLAAGRLFGRFAARLAKKRKAMAVENIQNALGCGPAEAERIATEVFENLGMNLMEFMRIPWLTSEDLDALIKVEGREHIDEALKRNRGIIVVTAHEGNWELMAAWYAINGYRADIVVRELDSPLAEDFVAWVRTVHGNRLVYKRRSMRKLLKRLSENAIAGILLDQNVEHAEGVFVDFFGRPACTNKGPAMLAAISGAVVIPSFIVREGRLHRIFIGPPIEVATGGDREADALENTARFTAVIEDFVRRYPGQWFWVHRRWKTRPDGEARGGQKGPKVVLYN